MSKRLSLATLGIVSSTLIGCSNQVESIQPVQQNQSQQVSAQSNLGLSNMMKNFVELIFSYIDRDNDGILSQKDFVSMPSGLSSEEKVVIFRKIDKDNDGKISLEDVKLSTKLFLSAAKMDRNTVRSYAQREFDRYDTDKDGFINESDFMNNVARSYDYFLNEKYEFAKVAIKTFMFEASDRNNDKKLSFSEYEDFFYNMATGIMKGSLLGSAVTPTPIEPPPAK